MKRNDYSKIKDFLHDEDLMGLLCVGEDYTQLRKTLLSDDFLEINETIRVPFFAETRGYVGAIQKSNNSKWLVKPVTGDDIFQAAMGAMVFFLDFFTKTCSAPTSICNIQGKLYRVTKLLPKAEQLSGANYSEVLQLKDQLVLDLINRWIYGDEDRNPNNYMIKYNTKNDAIVIAIDFSNVDFYSTTLKIKGIDDSFGWERHEKTRYLTPLKYEAFELYDMRFLNQRFHGFANVNETLLNELFDAIFIHDAANRDKKAVIVDNILKRIKYVTEYFTKYIPEVLDDTDSEKYKDMGSTFVNIYDKH